MNNMSCVASNGVVFCQIGYLGFLLFVLFELVVVGAAYLYGRKRGLETVEEQIEALVSAMVFLASDDAEKPPILGD